MPAPSSLRRHPALAASLSRARVGARGRAPPPAGDVGARAGQSCACTPRRPPPRRRSVGRSLTPGQLGAQARRRRRRPPLARRARRGRAKTIGWPACTRLLDPERVEPRWTVGVTTISFASTTPISTRSRGRERTKRRRQARDDDPGAEDEVPFPLGHGSMRLRAAGRRWLPIGSRPAQIAGGLSHVKLVDNVL